MEESKILITYDKKNFKGLYSCEDNNASFALSQLGRGLDGKARRITIYKSFFNSGFSKIGILRHEMGHILGFRHTCYLLPPNHELHCPLDRNLTHNPIFNVYDSTSDMKSFGGACAYSDFAWEISDLDALLIKSYYP